MMKFAGILLLSCAIWLGCQSAPPTPKPRAYPRIEWPDRTYVQFDQADCPLSFEYPAFAEIVRREEPCWFDIHIPQFRANLHCSYMPVTSREAFDELVFDAFVIATKINERANAMEETRISNPNGVGGLALRWSGPAASPVHFFLTDTTQHFFKASLYFESRTAPDSLAPIVDFLMTDIDKLIASFSWK